jgi:hypothetical protein
MLLFSACSINSTNENGTVYGILDWPQSGLATLLPTPSSTSGKVFYNTDQKLMVYIADFSTEDFEAYIEECKSLGFDQNIWNSTSRYSAQNKTGESLVISLDEDSNVARLDVYTSSDFSTAKTETADSEENLLSFDEEDPQTPAKKEASAFKKKMNEIEDFFIDYTNFILGYYSNEDILPLSKSNIVTYMGYRSECKEMVAKLDEIKESELSEEEEKIYQDAVGRINRLYEICARYEKGV